MAYPSSYISGLSTALDTTVHGSLYTHRSGNIDDALKKLREQIMEINEVLKIVSRDYEMESKYKSLADAYEHYNTILTEIKLMEKLKS